MPKESLSVYLTAVDKMSPVLASITDKTKALDKESQELQQTYEALQKANKGLIDRKTELQKKLQEVNEEVKEARKNFKELGDEVSSNAYKKAQEDQQKLRNEIAATNKALQENQKIYKENIETVRKGGMEGQGTGLSDIAKGLFAGQIGQMFSSSLGGLGQSLLTSAIGTPEASLISDMLSSAISGGAAGAMFGHWGIAAGAALGMGTGDMTAVAQALGRMKSSDKATLEYLNILNDRGIGAVGMLARAKGVSQGGMYGMISKGEISGSEAVTIITEALREAYSGAMEEQSQTFSGISSTLEGLTQELENAGGEGYNTLRESGQSAMVDAYQGELGESIKEINRIMGENQARKENLQDQYMREVLDRVLNGNRGELWSTFDEDQQNKLTEMSERYAYLMRRYENGDTDAGAELESLYEQAQALGKAYFENSDEVARLNEIEREEVTAIQEATAGLKEATQATYNMSQTLSKGLVVTPSLGAAASSIAATYTAGGDARSLGNLTPAQIEAMRKGNSHAFGLERVPYDDYPALLHEGERVLTASEARAQDAGTGSPVSLSITGNYFTGTPEEMADQLAQIILQRLTQAGIAAAPK